VRATAITGGAIAISSVIPACGSAIPLIVTRRQRRGPRPTGPTHGAHRRTADDHSAGGRTAKEHAFQRGGPIQTRPLANRTLTMEDRRPIGPRRLRLGSRRQSRRTRPASRLAAGQTRPPGDTVPSGIPKSRRQALKLHGGRQLCAGGFRDGCGAGDVRMRLQRRASCNTRNRWPARHSDYVKLAGGGVAAISDAA
jgi:hypothetical protein